MIELMTNMLILYGSYMVSAIIISVFTCASNDSHCHARNKTNTNNFTSSYILKLVEGNYRTNRSIRELS